MTVVAIIVILVLFYYCYCYLGRSEKKTVDFIGKVCLCRNKDKNKHKLLLLINLTHHNLCQVVLADICGEGKV